MNYLWDESLHLFRQTDTVEFPYSDGKEVEDRLLELVTTASDRGTFSQELAAAITDWPSEYHLSRTRHCLIRPLGIQPGDRVLELGCGCGAITRFLGEIGAQVVAVEGSLRRARVAAQRCRDCSHVRVVVDDLLHFETDERFDWVLLVGVLEYAAVFSEAADPFQHYLRSVTRFLGQAGKLVVAIENKLGLKYFNGCAEDHMGVPFFGVQDLYHGKTPRTFGRRELIAQLESAGLPCHRFFYPFPDYKLPSVILAEAAFTDPEFDPVDLVVRCHARDYTGSTYRAFDEALVFSNLSSNGLMTELSNSFLVVATRDATSDPPGADLAVNYTVRRSPAFAMQTRFVRRESKLLVVKEYLIEGAHCRCIVVGNMRISSKVSDCEYRRGRQLLWKVLKARAQSADVQAIVEALHPWMEFLMKHARLPSEQIEPALAQYFLPGNFLDCSPFNVLDNEGELTPIDFEWVSDSEIPLGWVVTRGVLVTLAYGVPIADPCQSIVDVVARLCQGFGLAVQNPEILNWLKLEDEYQVPIRDCPSDTPTGELMSPQVETFSSAVKNLELTRRERDEQEQQLHVLSAQITALSAQVTAFSGQITALSAVIANRDQSIGLLQRRIAEFHSALTAREKEVVGLNLIQARLSAQIEQLQRELENRRQQIAMLEGSLSWRVTRILRTTSARFPRGRRWAGRAMHLLWWTITLQLPSRLAERRRLLKSRDKIVASGLFDGEWYLHRYPDVASAGFDPALHYLLRGAEERRNPGPKFDAQWYVDHHADVARSGANPLLHYLEFGAAEKRELHPVASDPAASPGKR